MGPLGIMALLSFSGRIQVNGFPGAKLKGRPIGSPLSVTNLAILLKLAESVAALFVRLVGFSEHRRSLHFELYSAAAFS